MNIRTIANNLLPFEIKKVDRDPKTEASAERDGNGKREESPKKEPRRNLSQEELDAAFPNWLKTIAKSISQKTEEQMLLIAEHGIKKASSTIKPLSIDEQRHYLQLLNLV